MRKLAVIWVLFGLVLSSCEDDGGPVTTDPNAASGNYQSGVFIINEGNFGWGQGNISFYHNQTGKTEQQIFEKLNDRVLGNVAQSMTIHNGKGYIVVNNSQKIEVVDPKTMSSIGIIEGLQSPRYLLGIDANKAYASDLYADELHIIDLNQNVLSGSIALEGWSEQMMLHNGLVYVLNPEFQGSGRPGNRLIVIDPNTDKIVDSLNLTAGPNSMVVDANGKLWLLCDGAINKEIPALYRINPTDLSIEVKLDFGSLDQSPGGLCIDDAGTTLYYLDNGIHELPIAASAVSTIPIINERDRLFYNLEIEPGTDILHTADAVDYIQEGWVFRYRTDGTVVDSFKAGVIPGDFCFWEN